MLTKGQHDEIRTFFAQIAQNLYKVLVPGGHVFLASHAMVSHLVDLSFVDCGFAKRGQVVRVVKTLRGGDRPKNAPRRIS